MGSTSPLSPSSKPLTIYFGYGSNLWLHQMQLRCPTSTYLGLARLDGYKWIINDRGYANIVETKDEENEVGTAAEDDYSNCVFGMVYSLQERDEERLDKNEGVPYCYTKEDLECKFWPSHPKVKDGWVDVSQPAKRERKMLVYIDRQRVEVDRPKKEYILRMNMGIKDAVKMGVPKQYVEGVMRRFIPEMEGEVGENKGKGEGKGNRCSVEVLAMKQAGSFEDEKE
ncbi:hypothetical protein GQ43DRAFT_440491 [Delitschia confertaspora ATCC 74209]|uniref:gamma-glutamylcyclotransferase n=1 Tax=Delitschia confertaspora ATCC 74209 TaxID=1513339 RepID=A0A9P4JLD8_9PLEO|nr:hypothetical protein GQ43DRAFT_440491 [Delitschia confertaspora ATCC 74209]